MTHLIDQINDEIQKFSLLKHKFYQMWQEGRLTLDHLAGYSKEYYQLVKAVPSLVENTQNNNKNEKYETLLQSNLNEERDHIQPWINFATSLKVGEDELSTYQGDDLTNMAVRDLIDITNASFEEGVATLYAFEKELPKISETKSAGLKNFYDIVGRKSHEYFEIHREVDIYHAKVWENILNEFSEDKHEKILNAVKISLKAQNKLLDAVQKKYVDKTSAC